MALIAWLLQTISVILNYLSIKPIIYISRLIISHINWIILVDIIATIIFILSLIVDLPFNLGNIIFTLSAKVLKRKNTKNRITII